MHGKLTFVSKATAINTDFFLKAMEMPLLLYNSFYQKIVGGLGACNAYAILGSFSGIGGAATNAVIAFDRFKAISSPMDGKTTGGQAIFFIILTWAWSMPFTSKTEVLKTPNQF